MAKYDGLLGQPLPEIEELGIGLYENQVRNYFIEIPKLVFQQQI